MLETVLALSLMWECEARAVIDATRTYVGVGQTELLAKQDAKRLCSADGHPFCYIDACDQFQLGEQPDEDIPDGSL